MKVCLSSAVVVMAGVVWGYRDHPWGGFAAHGVSQLEGDLGRPVLSFFLWTTETDIMIVMGSAIPKTGIGAGMKLSAMLG